MRKVAVGPLVAILIAALPSAIAATGVDGSYNCSSTSACFSASQSGPSGSSGAGFHGSAVYGPGVRGNSTNETGILGQSAAGSLYSPGVEGESTVSTSSNAFDVAGGFGLSGLNGGRVPAEGVYAIGSSSGVYGGNSFTAPATSAGVTGYDGTGAAIGVMGESKAPNGTQSGTAILALSAPEGNSQIPTFQNGVALQALDFNANATSAYFQTGTASSTIPAFSNGISLEALNFNTNGTGAYFQVGSTGSSSSTIPTFSNGIALVAQNLNSSGQAAYFSEPVVSYGEGDMGGGYVDLLPPPIFGPTGLFESQNIIDGFNGASGFTINTDGNETLTGSLEASSVYAGSGSGASNVYIDLADGANMLINGGNESADLEFYIDNQANGYFDGNLTAAKFITQKSTQSRTRGMSGNERIAYGTRSTAPSLDDVGGGQLVNGSAYVRLDPALADSIDPRAEYRVFVTPQGDSNQLYVTQKSPTGFAVREAHGGRSTIAFDYRIVAKPVDDDGRRLAIAPPIHRPAFPSTHRRSSTWAQTLARHAASLQNRHFAHTHVLGLQALTPQQRFKQMVGPAKYAQALAEFKREQR